MVLGLALLGAPQQGPALRAASRPFAEAVHLVRGDASSHPVRGLEDDGRESVELTLPVEEARRQIRSSGVVTLLLASTGLESGKYSLRVTIPEFPDQPPLLEVAFQVR